MVAISLHGAIPASASTGYLTEVPDGGGAPGFFSLEPQTMQLSQIGTTIGFSAIAAGTDGELYGIEAESQTFHQFDRQTGALTDSGKLADPPAAGEYFSALTAMPGGTFYAASYSISLNAGDSEGQLYTVDPQTGAATAVGASQGNDILLSLAGSCDGTLYGVDNSARLVSVDPSTGEHTVIGPLAPAPMNQGGFTIAFDHKTGQLWALDYETQRFYLVDPATGDLTATSYSQQLGAQLYTLAFDSPAGCRYERTIELSYSKRENSFDGTLAATHAPCLADQRVKVFRKRRGPDPKLGEATTDATGVYEVPAKVRRGKFYARAAEDSSPDGVCLAATSPVLRVG